LADGHHKRHKVNDSDALKRGKFSVPYECSPTARSWGAFSKRTHRGRRNCDGAPELRWGWSVTAIVPASPATHGTAATREQAMVKFREAWTKAMRVAES
jgi:hypothetical protein